MSRLNLHDAPAAGFDQPFEMLDACHERLRRSLGLLQRLVDHVGDHGVDEQAADAARDVLRYFDRAAPAHHEDEERHVFPRLRAGSDARLIEAVERLAADHRTIAALWQPVRVRLVEWTRREGGLDDAARAAIDVFIAIHADHLRCEDELVFPAARAGVADAALAAMGEEMRSRRSS